MTSKHTVKQAATAFFRGQSQTARGARTVVGASLIWAPAGGVTSAVLQRPKQVYTTYKHAAAVFAAVMQIASVMPALGPNYKLGLRFGTVPDTKTLDQVAPILGMTGNIGPDYLMYTPFPMPDFGFAAVPNDSQRLQFELNKSSVQSRGGEHTSRSGTPSAGLSTPGPSAQSQSRASRNKPRGMISPANRRGAPSRGRRRPRPPYCATHKRRHWCRITRKR